ncbi:hypothetical protein B0H14DRAFT_3167482, partial [Mycena olivaceomarginata]
MDEERPTESQVASEYTYGKHVSPRTQYRSAFFSHSKHFTVAGGTFTMINEAAPKENSAFRTIPFGDLNLLQEVRHDPSGVVHRRNGRASMRRMYKAWIPGLQSVMTAALFQGEGAEEQWREMISRYSNLRHPNLLQLYGIASTRGLHAAVFHDDLVPYKKGGQRY